MGQLKRCRRDSLTLERSIPLAIRQQMPLPGQVYCQMCGISPGDIDEYTGSVAQFCADWVPDNGLSFRSRFPPIRILCSTCKQGAKNITSEKPTGIWLLSQVRRAGIHEQKAVFEWLSKKFGK